MYSGVWFRKPVSQRATLVGLPMNTTPETGISGAYPLRSAYEQPGASPVFRAVNLEGEVSMNYVPLRQGSSHRCSCLSDMVTALVQFGTFAYYIPKHFTKTVSINTEWYRWG